MYVIGDFFDVTSTLDTVGIVLHFWTSAAALHPRLHCAPTALDFMVCKRWFVSFYQGHNGNCYRYMENITLLNSSPVAVLISVSSAGQIIPRGTFTLSNSLNRKRTEQRYLLRLLKASLDFPQYLLFI
jgi:hypothetical protein